MKHLLLILLMPIAAIGQQPPTPVEAMFGNNRLVVQMTTNKSIGKSGKFGFFNATITQADYKNTASEIDIISSNALTYALSKSLSVTSGVLMHYKLGMVPTAGIKFQKVSPGLMILVFPMLDFKPSLASENLAILEIKPSLGKSWRLYTRSQLLYIHNLNARQHARSGYIFRAGLSHQQFSFGLGHNWDFYGPTRLVKPNTGIFIQARL